ncbi:MAG TPA: PIN domain-containing protein [Streptosporangiaceae bacterium]|nr:PIN domain-containing protein [Streptosporangiaceae bacterium]
MVYDSGALIAIDSRRDDLSLRRHQRRITGGDHIIVPAPVAAQVVRDPRRQARLMLTLQSCDIVPFEPDHAGPVGRLLALSGTSDVVDGFVAIKAAETGAAVVTSDTDDILHLLGTLGLRLSCWAP